MPRFENFIVAKDSEPTTIAVIGHLGRMGQMFCHLWEKAGHHLQCVDLLVPRVSNSATAVRLNDDSHLHHADVEIESAALQKAVTGAKIVVICVPVLALPDVLQKLSCMLCQGQVLVDITSVKTIPMQQMQAAYAGAVVGTHPLFGPVAEAEDLTVVITPGQNATRCDVEAVKRLFTCFSCKVMESTPEEHDLGVGFAQALNFVTNAMYFATVAEKPELLPFITPSFRRRMHAGEKQLTDDANMFLGFVAANPQMSNTLAAFKKILEKVEKGEIEEVVRKAQTWYKK